MHFYRSTAGMNTGRENLRQNCAEGNVWLKDTPGFPRSLRDSKKSERLLLSYSSVYNLDTFDETMGM